MNPKPLTAVRSRHRGAVHLTLLVVLWTVPGLALAESDGDPPIRTAWEAILQAPVLAVAEGEFRICRSFVPNAEEA